MTNELKRNQDEIDFCIRQIIISRSEPIDDTKALRIAMQSLSSYFTASELEREIDKLFIQND